MTILSSERGVLIYCDYCHPRFDKIYLHEMSKIPAPILERYNARRHDLANEALKNMGRNAKD
jgi:hypothetical protein